MRENLNTDIIMITIMSFLGFCIEDAWMLFRYSYIDNRNMHLPFLLGYGLLMTGVYYIVGTPDNIFGNISEGLTLYYPKDRIVYFVLCMLVVSAGEIALGTFVEKTGGYEYWNYSQVPLHITKYTSIPTSAGFALLMTVFMGHFYVPMRESVDNISADIPSAYIIMISALLIIDFISSFNRMYSCGGTNELWKLNVPEVRDPIKDLLHIQH